MRKYSGLDLEDSVEQGLLKVNFVTKSCLDITKTVLEVNGEEFQYLEKVLIFRKIPIVRKTIKMLIRLGPEPMEGPFFLHAPEVEINFLGQDLIVRLGLGSRVNEEQIKVRGKRFTTCNKGNKLFDPYVKVGYLATGQLTSVNCILSTKT